VRSIKLSSHPVLLAIRPKPDYFAQEGNFSLLAHLRVVKCECGNVEVRFEFIRAGKTFNSAGGLPTWVQIPVLPSVTCHLLYELLSRVRLGFRVVSPLRIACKFLHWERGQSSKRVWRSHRIVHLFCYHILPMHESQVRLHPEEEDGYKPSLNSKEGFCCNFSRSNLLFSLRALLSLRRFTSDLIRRPVHHSQ
jgi:hypothetical protein